MGVTQRGATSLDAPPLSDDDPAQRSLRRRLAGGPATVVAFTVAVVLFGIGVRFASDSPLWLDEALSVHIARLPLGDIPEALRHDGHPPLYYVLLHGWMAVFGEGAVAARALSGVFGVLTMPLAWIAGRRTAGRAGGWAALVLVAVNPYAIRYATETRMYALLMLLVFAGWLLLGDVQRRPTMVRAAALAAVTAALVLTQYWAIYLVAAVALVLLVRALRTTGTIRRGSVIALAAVGAGAAAFLVWVPVFLHQAAHTGTPWATAARPTAVAVWTIVDFGGGPQPETHAVGIALLILVLLGLFGRGVDRNRVELDLRTRPELRRPLLVAALTLLIGSAAGYVAGSAYATRYAAVVFPMVIVAAGVGVTRLVSVTARALVVVAVVALSAAGAVRVVTESRTQAGEIAASLRTAATDGDVVVFCPDQLGPAVVHAGLPEGADAVVYPTFGHAERVDWVDYQARNEAAVPTAFADSVIERAGDNAIFLVFTSGYRTLGTSCEELNSALAGARPGSDALVRDHPSVWEHAWLVRYPPPG